MGNFNRGDKFGAKKSFGGGGGGFRRGGSSERPQMHRATCAECGKDCEVPFRPSGDKPVYCSDCFGKKEGSSNARFDSRRDSRDSGRPSFGDKPMFKTVCDKCHKECEVPFRPSGDKPVFCSDCFVRGDKNESRNGSSSAGSDSYKKQFEMLNNKLDNILKILSPKTANEKKIEAVKPVIKEVKKIVEAVKPVIKETKKVVEKKVEAKKVVVSKKAAVSKKPVKKAAAKKKK
jgi:CxxC-x17-CxxC domain-containing protein